MVFGHCIRQKADGDSSTVAQPALILEEPPRIDTGEIIGKGHINERAAGAGTLLRHAARCGVLASMNM